MFHHHHVCQLLSFKWVPILWRIRSRHQYKTILKKCCMKIWHLRFLPCGFLELVEKINWFCSHSYLYFYLVVILMYNRIILFKEFFSSRPWSYGSWIYNYLCNQSVSPLMLWVRISIRARCTTLCDKVCQWLPRGRWFSVGPPVSSTNKTDRHDITEIL
jgi:hypothetical protein